MLRGLRRGLGRTPRRSGHRCGRSRLRRGRGRRRAVGRRRSGGGQGIATRQAELAGRLIRSAAPRTRDHRKYSRGRSLRRAARAALGREHTRFPPRLVSTIAILRLSSGTQLAPSWNESRRDHPQVLGPKNEHRARGCCGENGGNCAQRQGEAKLALGAMHDERRLDSREPLDQRSFSSWMRAALPDRLRK